MPKYMFDSLNPKNNAQYDSASANAAQAIEATGIDVAALNSDIQSMRKAALVVALELAGALVDGELGENELPSDRLDVLLAGFAATDESDDEIEVDQATLDIFIANVQDALETLGVDSDLIGAMFGGDDDADEAIEAAAEMIESNAPTGDEVDELLDLFVFGEAEDEQMLDGVSLGKTTSKSGKFGKVVYKAVKAIRNGKVTVVNKRVSGKVKLSPKQRMALSKARRKAGSGASIAKRMRSLKKSKKLGI